MYVFDTTKTYSVNPIYIYIKSVDSDLARSITIYRYDISILDRNALSRPTVSQKVFQGFKKQQSDRTKTFQT